MPIQFQCPRCGTQTTVADHFAGQSGPCKTCGQPVTVPGGAAPAYYTPSATKMSPSPQYGMPAPQKKRGAGSVILFSALGIGGLVVLCCCGGFVSVGFVGYFAQSNDNACQMNLRQIGLAIQNYHDVNGRFPPRYLADADGKPLHSWRVLILPYLERSDLYDQIRLYEPWDSPHNRQFHSQMPAVFCCPADKDPSEGQTNYMAVAGAMTLEDAPYPVLLPSYLSAGAEELPLEQQVRSYSSYTSIASVVDGLSNTALVFEVAESRVNWMAPVDLDLQGDYRFTDEQDGKSISSWHPGGANVVMCDGSVHTLSPGISPEALEHLIDRRDGYILPGDQFEE